MTTTYIRGAVPLAEVAAVTKRPVAAVEAEALELGLHVVEDWAGRHALAEADAQRLVSGDARRDREHDAAWAAHLAACARWTAARDTAVQKAYADAQPAPGRLGGGAAADAARQAASEAGRRYEETTPPPLWEGREDGNAGRRFTDRPAKGLIARTVGRVKAGAR